jgi:hypothetical protein
VESLKSPGRRFVFTLGEGEMADEFVNVLTTASVVEGELTRGAS